MCIASFARIRDLSAKRLYHWRQRLSLSDSKDPSSSPASTEPTVELTSSPLARGNLVPIKVTSSVPSRPRQSALHDGGVTLHTAAGHCISVEAGFNPDALHQLLSVLAEVGPC